MAEIAGRKLVLQALVGSHNYNLNTPESDEDFKYFVVPSFEDLYRGNFYSEADQGDVKDYSVHDIRKLSMVIWKANINFIEVMFSKRLYYEPEVGVILKQAERFAAMNLPAFKKATYGMHLDKMATLHKGTAKTDILVANYGYDTKQATHALRCLYVLERYMQTGSMAQALYFEDNSLYRASLLNVKSGYLTEEEFRRIVGYWHSSMEDKVNEFYDAKVADMKAMADLDEITYKFVKKQMRMRTAY